MLAKQSSTSSLLSASNYKKYGADSPISQSTSNILKYIPSLVIQHILQLQNPAQRKLPEVQPLQTAIMFADISGFTSISQKAAELGARGSEQLAFVINRYMEELVRIIGNYGGDIIKFIGDAMIVLWPMQVDQSLTGDGTSLNSKAYQGIDSSSQISVKSSQDQPQLANLCIYNNCRKSIQCALEIQKKLNNKSILKGFKPLSVKIGIGVGKCALMHVGGVFNRAEFFAVGEGLQQALDAQHHIGKGGEIVISSKVWQMVQDNFIATPVDDGFMRVTQKKGKSVKIRADALIMRDKIEAQDLKRVEKYLRAYVPAAIIPYIEIDKQSFGAQTRRLTIMFVSLGVDLSQVQSQKGLRRIQNIFTTVQKCVYFFQGSINKLVMDDKGSTLICIWGLPPYAHHDDPTRAVLTALMLQRQLGRNQLPDDNDCWCNIGIATGVVFSGVVGTSGFRKEYSVLGDSANLAARIMVWPIYSGKKDHGYLHVDQTTKVAAENDISFNYRCHFRFKGKSVNLPIYYPIDPQTEFKIYVNNNNLSPGYQSAQFSASSLSKISNDNSKIGIFGKLKREKQLLKLHSNPFIADDNGQFQKKRTFFAGQNEKINEFLQELEQFITTFEFSKIISIQGPPGSGKSLFVRAAIDKFNKTYNEENEFDGNEQPILMIGCLNLSKEKDFLNIWRNVLKKMLLILARRNRMRVENMVSQLIQPFGQQTQQIIKEVFLITDPAQKRKISKDRHDISFLKNETYSVQIVENIIDFIINFFRLFLNEFESDSESTTSYAESRQSSKKSKKLSKKGKDADDDIYDQYDDSYEEQKKKNQSSQVFKKFQTQRRSTLPSPPLLIIFDNTWLIDVNSWNLLLRIKEQIKKVAVVLIIQTAEYQNYSNNSNHDFNIHKDSLDFFNQNEIYDQFDYNIRLEPLNFGDLTQIMAALYNDYRRKQAETIKKMCQPVKIQPEKQGLQGDKLKEREKQKRQEEEKCAEMRIKLLKQYKLDPKLQLRYIDDQILKYVLQKCQGNPQLSLEFLFQLLSCKIPIKEIEFIQLDEMGYGQPTTLFKECKQLDNWIRIPSPPFAIKYAGEFTDKISRQTKYGAKLVLLLKAASVIGENFTLAQLIAANPVRKQNKEQIEKYIYTLEDQNEFQGYTPIEIMDDTVNHGLLMRFIKPFHKEVIYQRMIYNEQRKPIHIICSKYLQENQSIEYNLQTECKRLIWHILASEDLQTEEQLSSRARQKVTIKKVQNLLLSGAKVIKTGLLTKQGEKAGKNIEKRYIILTPTEFQYFHSQEESKTIKYPLGTIYLQSIYSVMNAKRTFSTSDFFIGAGRWRKKNKDKQLRQFVFGAKDDDQKDDWVTTIKLLRARAIHKGFQNKFGKLNIHDLDKKTTTPVSPSNDLFRQKTNVLNASFATGVSSSGIFGGFGSTDSSVLPFKRSKTNKFRRDSQISITSSIKDKRKESSFNKKIRGTTAFKQNQQGGSIISQQVDFKLKQSLVDFFGFALGDLFGSIGCNTIAPKSTKIGRHKTMLSGMNSTSIQLQLRPSLISNDQYSGGGQALESPSQIKGSFSSISNNNNNLIGANINNSNNNIINNSNNNSINLSITQIQSPTKVSAVQQGFVQSKISRKLTTIQQDQQNQDKDRNSIKPRTFKPPEKTLRRSLTSATNNPSLQSFKFDITRINSSNNPVQNNPSNRYDKISVTPTASSPIQNYPPSSTDGITMDRSFSPISGGDFEAFEESRKSSNIASAVIFQQSDSDINLHKKEQKQQIIQQEQNARQILEYDDFSSRDHASSSMRRSLTLSVQKYDEMNEVTPKIVDRYGQQVLFSKSINNKIQTIQKINSRLLVQEVVTKQQKSIHRPNVSMFTFETLLQRSMRLNISSSRKLELKNDYSSISPSSAILNSHRDEMANQLSNISSRPMLSSRIANQSPFIQNKNKSGIIQRLTNEMSQIQKIKNYDDERIKSYEEEKITSRHHKQPSKRYTDDEQLQPNDSYEIIAQNNNSSYQIPAKKRHPTFQESNFQDAHLFFKDTQIPQFNAMFPNKYDMDSNGDQKLLAVVEDLTSLKQSQKVSPRFNKFTNFESLGESPTEQQQQQQLLRASDFPHNNLLLGSGNIKISKGDLEDKSLTMQPKRQQHQQQLDSQKSELNKFKQKFMIKQQQRRLSSLLQQNHQTNKQKQKMATNQQYKTQFVSIQKLQRPGINESKFLKSQIKNNRKEQKQYVVTLHTSTALNNPKLRISQGKLVVLKRQIPGENKIYEIQIKGQSGLFQARNFKKISQQTDQSSIHQDLQFFSTLSNRQKKIPSAIAPVEQGNTSFDASFRQLIDDNNPSSQKDQPPFEYLKDKKSSSKNILDDSFKQISTIKGIQNESSPTRIKNNIALDQMDDSLKTSLQNLLLFTPSPDNNKNKIQDNLIELKRVEQVEEEQKSSKFSSIIKVKNNNNTAGRNFNMQKASPSPQKGGGGVQMKAVKRKTKNFIQKKDK